MEYRKRKHIQDTQLTPAARNMLKALNFSDIAEKTYVRFVTEDNLPAGSDAQVIYLPKHDEYSIHISSKEAECRMSSIAHEVAHLAVENGPFLVRLMQRFFHALFLPFKVKATGERHFGKELFVHSFAETIVIRNAAPELEHLHQKVLNRFIRTYAPRILHRPIFFISKVLVSLAHRKGHLLVHNPPRRTYHGTTKHSATRNVR